MSKTQVGEALAVSTSLLDELGIPDEERAQFIMNWATATRLLTASPQQELQWRLNAQLRGDDPGPSVNWAGVRGMR